LCYSYLAAKVFQTGEKGIWEQAKTFQQLIHDYQKISTVAKETFIEESDRLLREREELDSIFAFNDACGTEELSTIRRVLRQKQRSVLRSFNKDYRQARNQLGAFVRDRSLFKNHALADLIERLEYFLR
jgi:hypothetical protein